MSGRGALLSVKDNSMMQTTRTLTLLYGAYAVCRLEPDAASPDWVRNVGLSSITRTTKELSIVSLEAMAPADIKCERDWRCLEVAGPIPFSEVGVVAGLTQPLAAGGISVFVVSTYDTDYILVPGNDYSAAVAAWRGAGVEVIEP
jgi:hypothetical protein